MEPCEVVRDMVSSYGVDVLASRSKLEDHNLSLSATSYLMYSKLPSTHLVAVLYPEPEGTPCSGNRDPLIQTDTKYLLQIEPYHQQLHSHSLHT